MTSMLFLLPLTTVNLACYLPTDWLSRTLVIKVIEDLKETKKISLAIYLCIYLVLWLCSYMKINFYLFFLSFFFFFKILSFSFSLMRFWKVLGLTKASLVFGHLFRFWKVDCGGSFSASHSCKNLNAAESKDSVSDYTDLEFFSWVNYFRN